MSKNLAVYIHWVHKCLKSLVKADENYWGLKETVLHTPYICGRTF